MPSTEQNLKTLLVTQVLVAALFGAFLISSVDDNDLTTPAVATGSTTNSGVSSAAASLDSVAVPQTPTSQGAPAAANAGAANSTNGTSPAGTGSAPAPALSGPGTSAAPSEASSGANPFGEAPAFDARTTLGVTDDVLRIGTLVSQTGAINFRSSAQATKAYIDKVNEQGGVHGRKIELLLRDDGLDPNRGQQAVEEMLNAGIFSFVAFNAPLTEGSMNPVLAKNDINMIGSFAMNTDELSYRFGAGYQNFGKVGGTRLCEAGITTPGLVYISNQNEDLDANIYESWRRGAEQCGLTITDDNLHPVDVTKADFTDVVTSLQFSGVDGIGTVLDATAMVRFQQALNRQGFVPFHAALPFGSDEAVLQDPNVGTSFVGMEVLSDVNFPGTFGMVEYEAEVRRRFGDAAEINWAGAQGWTSAMLFVETVRRTGPDLTRERFRWYLDRIEGFDTDMMAPHTFGEQIDLHSPNGCLKVGLVQADRTVREVQGFTCVSDDLTRF